MTVLPVVVREMSVLARRKSTYWSRTVTGLVSLLVMLWLLLVSRAQVSFSQMGSSIFLFLSSLCFAFAVLAGMHATSDSVSEEKREGTLGLLFLTDLRGWDVIGGKLAATSFGAVLALMGIIPMLSLALLLGGVTLAQFGLVAVVLLNTLFLSLSMGVFVSTLSENERKAMIGTFLGLLIVICGPFLTSFALNDSAIVPEVIALSPLFAFVKLHSPMALGTMGMEYFWYSLTVTHLLAWLLLFFSAHLLPRFVNAVPKKRTVRVRAFVETFVYGRIEQRKKHRAELLDRNAFLWLASRERVKPKYAWGVVIFFVGLYWWISHQVPNASFDLPIVITLMFLVHLVFKIWAASEVCSRLIEDRRSGALELLLSTPLSVKEIADGQTKALGRLFFRPIATLVLLEVLLLYVAATSGVNLSINRQRIYFFVIGLSTLILDIWALKWVGLWLSLTGKSIERILILTLVRILTVPWLLFAVGAGILGATMFLHRHDPTEFEAMTMWWGISILASAWFGSRAKKNFLTHFRDLAAKRFDAVVELEPAPRKEKTPTKSKFRLPGFYRRHPITATIFTLLAIVLLSALFRGWYWERKLESEFARLRATGFPTNFREVGSFAPPLPAHENAFAMLQGVGGVNAGRPFFANRKSDLNLTIAESNQFRAMLNGNEEILAALWKLPEYQGASLDVTKIDWNQYASQSGYIGLLEADLLNETFSSAGANADRLRKSLLAMITHTRFLHMQPSSQAQHNAQEALTRLRGVLHFASEHDVINEELLLELQRKVNELEKIDVLADTIAVHRALMLEIGRNPAVLNNRFGPALPKSIQMVQSFLAAIGVRDKQLVEMSQSYSRAIEYANLPIHERLRLGTVPQNVHPSGNIMGIMWFGADSPQIFWNDALFAANRNLIRSALAAELYTRKYGKPPNDLQELVPQFLAAIPEDPFTGGELKSVLSPAGLLIYSVGVDRIDNTADSDGAPNKADLFIRVK